MEKLILMNSYDFKDLPENIFAIDIEVKLDEEFINFMSHWVLNFSIPHILIFETISGIREELEAELKGNKLSYKLDKIKGIDRYNIFINDINEFISGLKLAIFEINQGFEGYIYIDKINNDKNCYQTDVDNLFKDYKYIIVLTEVGCTFISNDVKIACAEDVAQTFPKNVFFEIL